MSSREFVKARSSDLIRAFFTARPRHLRYGSIPGGIDWAVMFEIPVVDLHQQDLPLPPELTLDAGHLSVRTSVNSGGSRRCAGRRACGPDPAVADRASRAGSRDTVFASNNERGRGGGGRG
jgi:hypothetical protein